MLSGPSGAMYPHGSFVDRQSRELPDVVVSRADSRAPASRPGLSIRRYARKAARVARAALFVTRGSSLFVFPNAPSRPVIPPRPCAAHQGFVPPHRSQHPNHSRLPKPENMSSSTSAPVQQCVPYPTFGVTTHACGPGLTARSRHAVDTCATATLALRACLIR